MHSEKLKQIQKQLIENNIQIFIINTKKEASNMICVNSKRNQKLLQTFNNDPYSDIIIKTTTSQLNLVLGYLSIDSQYFDEQLPTIRQINLEHLNQHALIKILRALYGEETYASNVNQLKELYQVIDFLKINQYKDNIVKYISKNQQLMDNFELIQFCFHNNMLQQEIKKHHFDLKMAVFASTKNYLQLNKISQNTLNSMLIQYCYCKGQDADSTVNSIVQNYIGRNDLRPSQYFTQPGLEPLLTIWQKFHHSISYLISAQEKVRQSQMFINDGEPRKSGMQPSPYNSPLTQAIPTLTSNPSIGFSSGSINNLVPTRQSSRESPTSIHLPQLQEKQVKIQELQKMVELNNEIIQTLKSQIQNAKRQLYLNKKHPHIVQSDEQSQELAIKNRKKQFDQVLGLGRNNSQDYDVSLIQPPFNQARKIVNEEKQVKTMNKLNTKTKRIFN